MNKHTNHERTIAPDPMDTKQRSAQMAKVRGKGNRSTEGRIESVLIESNIGDWEKQPKSILGKPDFFFPKYKLVVFADGCFWHACPVCKRRTPKSQFWYEKLDTNRKRDNRVHRKLRQQGYHVMRVWEHELKKDKWLKRLLAIMKRIEEENKKS